MLFECKVMRPGEAPHEWTDVACYGWHRPESGRGNDGPAIMADSPQAAAVAALRKSVEELLDAQPDGDLRACVAVRIGAECSTFEMAMRVNVREGL